MLFRGDGDLARRDPAVVGLGVLLDPDALTARLRQVMRETDIQLGPVRYIKYQPGRNCLAAYEMMARGNHFPLHATAYHQDAAQKMQKARLLPGINNPLGSARVVLDDVMIVASFFPNDRKLPALACLATPGATAGL